MLIETPLKPTEISSHLTFHRTVLVYFKDSEIPARVMNVVGNSVYVQHGKRFFWLRLGNANVSRIVLYEFKSEVV